jgi:hypothetical protein
MIQTFLPFTPGLEVVGGEVNRPFSAAAICVLAAVSASAALVAVLVGSPAPLAVTVPLGAVLPLLALLLPPLALALLLFPPPLLELLQAAVRPVMATTATRPVSSRR